MTGRARAGESVTAGVLISDRQRLRRSGAGEGDKHRRA
jgi:hypothetical protein